MKKLIILALVAIGLATGAVTMLTVHPPQAQACGNSGC
jgi:hypothetical protein